MLPKSYAWVFVHYGEIDTIRLLYVSLYPEMGVRSWFCVPALLRSRYFRNAGMQIYTGTQKRGTQKNRNTKFAFLWRDDTVMNLLCVLRGEVKGGDCGRDMSLTPNRLPASIIVHRARVMRGVMTRWRVDPAHLIRRYTQSARDESKPPPPSHMYTLWYRSI